MPTLPDDSLEPPDLKRCQVEWTKATPFRLGGPARTRYRCENAPVVIATEKRPGEDGKIGAMSLCAECQVHFEKQLGTDYATYVPVPMIENWP